MADPRGRYSKLRFYIASLSIAVYFLIVTIEAPIRLYFGSAIQLRDAILVVAFAAALIRNRIPLSLIAAAIVLGVFTLYGHIINRAGSNLAAFFGAKQLFPGLVGIGYAGLLYEVRDQLTPRDRLWTMGFFCLTFLITLGGCLIDSVSPFPWAGETTLVLGEEREVSREWSADGVRRIAGFARASFDAAVIFGMSALVVGFGSNSRGLRFLIHCAAIPAIILTTTKGVLIAVVLVALSSLFREDYRLRPRLGGAVFSTLIVAACVLAAALPLLSAWGVEADLSNLSLMQGFDATSFGERMRDVWPAAIDDLFRDSTIFGWGIGGAGTPISVFSSNDYNPLDNLFLFLMSTTGIFSIVILGMMAFLLYTLAWQPGMLATTCAGIGLFALTYGITTSVMENNWLCFFLGFSTSIAFQFLTARNRTFPV